MTISMTGLPTPASVLDPQKILAKAKTLYNDEFAKEVVSQWQAAGTFKEFEFEDLSDLYAAPEEEIRFRVGGESEGASKGLWPANGTLLFAAQAKAGKTTAVLNLEHALVTGSKFLDRFVVKPLDEDDVLVILNNEVSSSQYTRWMKKRGIPQDPRVRVANLRGKAGSVNILDPGIREMFVSKLAILKPTILIVDPIGPIMRAMGVDENDNNTVGNLLDGFNGLRPDIPSLQDILVVHHSGHESQGGGQRAGSARGASAWNDIPDAIWNYRRDENNPGIRELKMRGRDVFDDGNVEVKFDPETLTLTSSSFSVSFKPGAGAGTGKGNGKVVARKPISGRGSGK